MARFFTRERFGQPQVLAGLLLLGFLGQCVWLGMRTAENHEEESAEFFRVQEGLREWHGQSIAGTPSPVRADTSISVPEAIEGNAGYDPHHSPLWYLLASAPFLVWPGSGQLNPGLYWTWAARLPSMAFGLLLGASLWYVARRLYGNAGGYIALSLYCFSPVIIANSVLWFSSPEMAGSWGSFGAVFTAIAVAHTLYAPREVVIWNWRRILLLGLSLALAVGTQFSLIVLAPMALAFMFYVAPARRSAALAIWGAACGLAAALLYASYAFRGAFVQGVGHASFWGIWMQAYEMPGAYRNLAALIGRAGPILSVVLPIALIVYCFWKPARYFGNTAPLLAAMSFILLGMGTPHYPGLGFSLVAIPFLLVFVAGIAADLLEAPHRGLLSPVIAGMLIANAVSNLVQLFRVGRG